MGSSKSAHQVRECSAHCGDEHLEGRKQAGLTCHLFTTNLLGGFKHGAIIFHNIWDISSFPLTNSYVSRWLSHHQPEIMVMDDLEVPRWLKKPAIFPIFRHPNSPSWWMRIPRTREKSNGVKSRGKHRSIQLYNSYISINKQVTIRDINGVKLLKSVIILNLLHF